MSDALTAETKTRTRLGQLILETAMGTEKTRIFSCIKGEHVWLRVGVSPTGSSTAICIGCGKQEGV